MLIDIIAVILLIFAIIKGFQRGLVVALFSLAAIIIGLAAAIKLSAVVADYIGKAVTISEKWLPVISFVIVFIGVLLLVRLVAKLVQKSLEWTFLGWINKLGGIIFYVLIYGIVFSIVLFYAEKINLLKPEVIAESTSYPVLQPLGPWVINGIGKFIPFFRDMFDELEAFFQGVAQRMS